MLWIRYLQNLQFEVLLLEADILLELCRFPKQASRSLLNKRPNTPPPHPQSHPGFKMMHCTR